MNSSADSDAFLEDLNLSDEDPLEFFPSEHQIAPGYGRRALAAVIRSLAALVAASRSGWLFAVTQLRLAGARVSTWRFPVSRLPRWRLPRWRLPLWRVPAVSRIPFAELASRALARGARLSSDGSVSTITVTAFACGVVVGGSAVWLAGASPRPVVNRTLSQQPVPGATLLSGSPVLPVPQPVRSRPQAAGVRPLPAARATSVTAASAPRPIAPTPRSSATNSPTRGSPALAPSATASSTTRPFRGALIVNSLPSGARVLLNGRSVGTTPLVLRDQPAGSRAIQVAMEGYEPWSAAVQVVAYTETRLRAQLKRRSEPAQP